MEAFGWHDEDKWDRVGEGLERQKFLPIHLRRMVAIYMAR